MRITATGFSTIGTGRKANGDTFIIDRPMGFYAVADTVGTFSGNMVPSYFVIEQMRDSVKEAIVNGDTDWDNVLTRAVSKANETVLRMRNTNPNGKYGTTLTCCLIRNTQAWFVHLGDSRAYVIQDGQIEQITRDETLAMLLYEKSMITSSAVLRHPGRNHVLNVIGTQPEIRITCWKVSLTEGMKILLCTDGVATFLPKEEILQIAAGGTKKLKSFARRMVESAREKGSRDDATAVVLGTA